jgi:hypothetical protein
MKSLLVTIAFVIFLFSQLSAQSPVPDPDTIRDPVKQGDPAPTVIPAQSQFRKNLIRIKPSELPEGVRKRLKHPAYKGWEKATISRNQSSTVYTVEFQEPNKTRIYQFDKYGQQLEDDE